MVKSIISILAAFLILAGGAVYEQVCASKVFNGLRREFIVIYENLDNETASGEDLLNAQKSWIKEKRKLHAFIPHNEIKELDLWIAEAVYYADKKDYEEAKGKVSVAIELLEQIPRTFAVSVENIF